LRSSEYHDRNPLYYWIVDAAGLKRPYIQDFARLNFAYVLLSKRKLQWFVDNGKVTGWNDPRMPTIQGVLRRGLTLDALKEFVLSQGASKAITLMEMDKLWAVNKKVLDPVVPRYTAIAKEGKSVLVLKVRSRRVGGNSGVGST
jgi:glutamyl/glutaminyl-tRNA synthetase